MRAHLAVADTWSESVLRQRNATNHWPTTITAYKATITHRFRNGHQLLASDIYADDDKHMFMVIRRFTWRISPSLNSESAFDDKNQQLHDYQRLVVRGACTAAIFALLQRYMFDLSHRIRSNSNQHQNAHQAFQYYLNTVDTWRGKFVTNVMNHISNCSLSGRFRWQSGVIMTTDLDIYVYIYIYNGRRLKVFAKWEHALCFGHQHILYECKPKTL